MKRPVVAYGIWIKEDKIFLLERNVREYRLPWPTVWEPPGGRIEWGENPADAAIREFQEETGLHAYNPRFLGLVRDDDSYGRRNALFFLVDAEEGNVKLGDPEHVGWRFIPLDEAARLENLALSSVAALYLLREWGLWDGEIKMSAKNYHRLEVFLPHRGCSRREQRR